MRKPTALFWKRCAISALSFLISLAALELLLRIVAPVKTFVNPLASFHQSDPNLGWSGIPNLKARFRKVDFDVLVRNDPGGFREKESPVHPNPGSPMLAVFGDSFVWGWGVQNGRLLTDVMQNELGTNADVRNFGVNAYGTVQEWFLLKMSLSNGVRPRAVFLLIFNNDLYENLDIANASRPSVTVLGTNVSMTNHPVSKQIVSPVKKALKRSYLFAAIASQLDFMKERRSVTDLQQATYENGNIAQAPQLAMKFVLGQFKQLCDKEGIQLCFVYIPAFEDLASDTVSKARSAITRLCGESDAKFLDLTPEFRQAGGGTPQRFYFPHDEHWNADGHALAGKVLAGFFKKEMPVSERRTN